MTYEEYKAELEKLKEAQLKLKRDYIKEHSVFQVGDRVLVKGVEGEVYGSEIDYFGDIRPLVRKVKKDGTVGQNKVFIYSASEVTKK